MPPWERGVHETKNRPGPAMERWCGRPAAPMDATRTPATRSPPGRWQHWRRETENDEVARQREPSERRGRRGQPNAQLEHGERPTWRRRRDEKEATAPLYLAHQMSDVLGT